MSLRKTYSEGYAVEIRNGQIWGVPPNGVPFAMSCKKTNWLPVAKEIASLTGTELYIYIGYVVSYPCERNQEQLTLHFQSVSTGRIYSTYCNVLARYDRKTAKHKAGTPLPKGRYRVKNGSKLAEFTARLNLAVPRYPCEHYRVLSQLKNRLFVAETETIERQQTNKNGQRSQEVRLNMDSINPAQLSSHHLATLLVNSSPNSWEAAGKHGGNIGANAGSVLGEGFTPSQGVTPHTANFKCNAPEMQTTSNQQQTTVTSPKEQSVDEWLRDYTSAD